MRVFKNKWFHRWAHREGITDFVLLRAADEILDGKVEADLGGGLFKKRLARAGEGKRGGYRTIVGYKRPKSDRIVFLYAFAKNSRGNISGQEEAALKSCCRGIYFSYRQTGRSALVGRFHVGGTTS